MSIPSSSPSVAPGPDSEPSRSRSAFSSAIQTLERVSAILLLVLVAWAVSPECALGQSMGVLEGTVVDQQNGEPLPGANVVLRTAPDASAYAGVTTSVDGTFRMEDIESGSYVLEVSFVGYQRNRTNVSVQPDDENRVTIQLALESQSLEQVVVSASRRQEKILDAPASISVVAREEVEQQVTTSPVGAVRDAMSVDVARTGVNSREIVLRGFNNAFSGDTYVLTDYREAAVPGLDANLFAIMPLPSVDVERVEVVRGPGSALYGPGVANGVVHFFSRDPFEDPSVTVSAIGGTRAYAGAEMRAAGFVDDFGFKVTGRYARADEWMLDPDDPQDAAEIEDYRIYSDRSDVPAGRRTFVSDFNGDGSADFRLRREKDHRSMSTSGLIEWRPSSETRVALDGGYSGAKSVVQSGIGTIQSDMYGYRYGQLRVRQGGFFGQVYYNALDSGANSYVYGSGDELFDESFQWNGQLQYNTPVPSLAADLTVGIDADLVRPRTGGTVTGRFEGRDAINQYGTYAQATFSLGGKVDLTAALRGDYNNVTEQLRGSPRGALVYRFAPGNSMRVSYNRSYSAPQTKNYFLDIEARSRTIFSNPQLGEYNVVLRGIGAVDGFSFDTFRSNRGSLNPNPAVRFFVPNTTPRPGIGFRDPVSLSDYPVAPVYRAAVAFFESQKETGDLSPELTEALGSGNLDTFKQLLVQLASNADGNIRASEDNGQVVLGLLNDDARLGYDPVSAPVDIEPLGQTMTQTIELGYKGQFDRVSLEMAGYFEQKQNFIGPLRQQSPFVFLEQNFAFTNIQSTVEGSPQALDLVDRIVDETSLRSRNQVYGLLAATVSGTPSAVVQPDDAASLFNTPTEPGVQEVGGFLSYRNFGEVEYWGLEGSIVYTPADVAEWFASFSFISDEFFTNEELGEANEQLSVALNAPSFKMKSGLTFRFDSGWMFGASGEYVDGFPVQSGPYIGDVDSYMLVDASVGYALDNGLRFDVTAENVFNNEHREFVGAPQIGRLILGRVTYELK
ncbi:MAG: TonB-dependent receptor [Bacteroidetes bacterium]|nr:TonB-dependent receptor [Bacteroidota bacterium]